MPDQDFQQYIRHRDPEAFRRLVQRHLNAVHSAAARVLGHRCTLAEDVVQTVFVLLARKASTLPEELLVGAWLHRQTVRRALNVLRTETRRERREHHFEENRDMNTGDNHQMWLELKPHLDRAMLSLPERDRQALVLRYLDERPLTEVGSCLGITPNAAQKRVSKALEALRRRLLRHRVMLPVTVLSTLLTENAVQAASAHTAAGVASNALAAAAGQTAFSLTSLTIMSTFKAAGAAAVLVLCAGAGWHSTGAAAPNSRHTALSFTGNRERSAVSAPLLNAWLTAIGQARVEDFPGLAEDALRDRNLLRRHDRLEAVFARWVEINPADGWAWVQEKCSESLREDRIPRDPRLAFLLSWTSVDGPAAYAAARRRPDSGRFADWDGKLAAQWAKQNPQGLLDFIASGKWEEGWEGEAARASALKVLAIKDPDGIYREALSMQDDHLRTSVIASVAEGMARRDAQRALVWVRELPPGSDAQAQAYVNLFGVMSDRDPERTAKLMDEILTGKLAKVKSTAARPLVESWMRSDPAAALKWASTLGREAAGILDGLVAPGTPAAESVQSIKTGGDHTRQEEIWSTGWASAAAREWLKNKGLPADEAGKISVRAALMAWAREEAPEAAAWVDQLPAGKDQEELRHLLLSRMARDGESETLVFAQLNRIQEVPEDAAVREMAASLGAERPAEILTLIGTLPAGQKRDAWLAQTAGAWAERDPAAAAAWADAIPSAETRAEVVEGVLTRWWPDDPAAAEAWASTQPEGNLRDKACSQMARAMTLEAPAHALVWAASIGGEEARAQRMSSVLKEWTRTQPAAALAALQALPLAAEEKVRLASAYTPGIRP